MKRIRLIESERIFARQSAQRWIVRPLLVRGSTMMLYGRPGLGKTTLAMQLALAIARGEPSWLGFPVLEHGPVAWLQLDMPEPELCLMLERAKQRNASAFAQMHFFEITEEDGTPLYEVNMLGGDAALIAAELRTLKPVALFVDTAADIYAADPRTDMNQQIRRVLRALAQAAPTAAIIFLQHQRKRPAGALGDDPDSYLGGMAWAGKASSVLQLNRRIKKLDDTEDGEAFEISHQLHLRKMRLGTEPCEQLTLERDTSGFFEARWKAREALKMLSVVTPEHNRDKALAQLSRHFGISREALKKALQRLDEAERPKWDDAGTA